MMFQSVLATLALAGAASALVHGSDDTNAGRFARGLGPKGRAVRTSGLVFNDPRRSRNLQNRQAQPSGSPQIALTSVCNAPSSYPLSCSSSSPAGTCCQTSPGGLLLQTQFWDTGSTSTGPSDSWTVHGLWPDNCDGTYQQYCDTAREIESPYSTTTIRAILQSYGETALLSYMDTYWKDYQGDDESFWEHEFDKHGTCTSSLEPECFSNNPAVSAHQDVHAYFIRTVNLFQTLPTYDWLVAEGIVPSLTATYTLAQIQAAIQKHRGNYVVNVNCAGSVLDEMWYFFNSQGSVIDGNFVPTNSVGSASTCPSTGIKWYPKYTTIPTSSAATLGIYPATVSSTGTVTNYMSKGIITGGVWYTGTPSTVTRTASTNPGYYNLVLKSSGAYCSISTTSSPVGLFNCATTNTASDFQINDADGVISYQGSTVFSAASVPSGSTRVNIYFGAPTTANPVQVQMTLATKQ